MFFFIIGVVIVALCSYYLFLHIKPLIANPKEADVSIAILIYAALYSSLIYMGLWMMVSLNTAKLLSSLLSMFLGGLFMYLMYLKFTQNGNTPTFSIAAIFIFSFLYALSGLDTLYNKARDYI